MPILKNKEEFIINVMYPNVSKRSHQTKVIRGGVVGFVKIPSMMCNFVMKSLSHPGSFGGAIYYEGLI